MSVDVNPGSAGLNDHCAILRSELKQWEQRFAAANGGRKAGREEIKRDGCIAAKYKEYNRLRASLSNGNPTTFTKAPGSPTKRTHPSKRPHSTPQKATRTIHTPRKQQRRHNHSHHANDSGVEILTSEDAHQPDGLAEDAENASPVIKRLFIDPTPQKNGRVLGLFDLLSPEKKAVVESPSKPRAALGGLDVDGVSNIHIPALGIGIGTPQKRARTEDEDAGMLKRPDFSASPIKHSRTPQSASKRYLLDTFVTPSKRRKVAEDAETPSRGLMRVQDGVGGLVDGTPAFLRRDSQRFSLAGLDDVAEAEGEGEDGDGVEDGFDTTTLSAKSAAAMTQNLSPSKSRLQRSFSTGSSRISKFNLGGKGLFRRSSSKSLSSMIAAMRQTEEDRLDEEMEMMREMENGYDNDRPNSRAPRQTKNDKPEHGQEENEIPEDVLVEDSQFPDISTAELGPDGSHVVDSDSELENTGEPRKVWKKKGLKRQTKRVVIRPTARRPAARPDVVEGGQGDEIVEESQNPMAADTEGGKDEDMSGSDYDDNELLDLDDSGDDTAEAKTKAQTKPTTMQSKAMTVAAPAQKQDGTAQNKAGPAAKATKKISATANANFCKLKIRSSKGAAGAKGAAFKRRFGKGRR